MTGTRASSRAASPVPPAGGNAPTGPTAPAGMAAIAAPPPTVVTPIMGGMVAITTTESAAWTGGIPKADWSELEDPTATFLSPNQLRPIQVGAAQKAYNARKEGLSTKFAKGGSIKDFSDKVLSHLEDTGMDTIAYLPSPTDHTKMINVIREHAHFTNTIWIRNRSNVVT